MHFLTPSFAAFLGAVTVAFYSLPVRSRWIPLLAGSYLFYWSWSPGFLWLVLLLTGTTYLTGLGLAPESKVSKSVRPALFFAGLALNLSLLAFFKIPGLLPQGILAPIGFSFFTLQSIAYLIEVRRGSVTAERHPGAFALYICFFPQLIAGPIERPGRLLPLLTRLDARFDPDRLRIAALLVFTGLFKKLVIGDSLAAWVDPVFLDPVSRDSGSHVVAALLGRYRIYCDFSGYTDIALGLASVFGITLMANFDRPFASATLAEFWRRWHISLSSWMRDYVYFPLLSSPFSRAGLLACLCVTFGALGLWHGGTANYLLFGLAQGLFIWAQHKASGFPIVAGFRAANPRLSRTLATTFTFVFLISLPTILFLAPDLPKAGVIFGSLLDLSAVRGALSLLAEPALLKGLALIAGLEALQLLHGRAHLGKWVMSRPALLRWALLAAAGSLFLALGEFGKPLDFIYRHF